jgi:hypothetical protein
VATSDHPGLLPRGIDPALAERLPHGGEVLGTDPLELVDLVRPPRQPVLEPVGQRRLGESAVPAARAPAAAIALEQHHVLARAAVQRGPQPVKPPPTIARSQLTSPSSGGSGSGAAGESSQKTSCSESASARLSRGAS